MSFMLAPYETPGGGLARAIREQAEKLKAECGEAKLGPDFDANAFAHKARVRAKKIRAALRLAKPIIGAKVYKVGNRWWRDAARELSALRDASARLEALEALRPFLTARIGSAMMRRLTERFEAQRSKTAIRTPIIAFRSHIWSAGDDLAPDLPSGSREDMMAALGETYREARHAMKVSQKHKKDPLLLHEWRKQTKYHALQARLLRTMFPEVLMDRLVAARRLSDVLGEAQDIEVVVEASRDWAEAPEGFFDVLEERRLALIAEAVAAGDKLFRDKPKDWVAGLATVKEKVELPPLQA